MDFECQEDGYVAQILAQAGTKDVLVSVPIAVIVEEESDVAAFAQFTIADIQGGKKDVASIVEEKANAITERVEVVEGIKESMVSQKGKIMASPIAKMMANEKGISLNALSGTGPDGLIVKADVEHYKGIFSQLIDS